MRSVLRAVLCAVLLPTPAAALQTLAAEATLVDLHEPSGVDCLGGERWDDGTFETGYGFTPGTTSGSYVMQFIGGLPVRIDAVCFAIHRSGTDPSFAFVLEFYRSDAGGTPSTLLAQTNQLTVNLPVRNARYFVRVGIVVGATFNEIGLYVGPRWNPSVDQNFFVAADEDGELLAQAFSATSNVVPNRLLGPRGAAFPAYKALGIRVEFALPDAVGPCTSSATALCLSGRYRVFLLFSTAPDTADNAKAVKLTDDAGYFYFNNPNNVEVLVKLVNGCPVNGNRWVFVAGLTNVLTTLTVIDRQTGVTRFYLNPRGQAFLPIQHTEAFAACP